MTSPSGSTPPRVLQLITLSDWGGAQQCVLTLARGLRHHYDVTVACGSDGPLVDRLRREGIRVIEIPGLVRMPRVLGDLRTLWTLARLMRAERYALVHCHSTKAGLLGRIAARIAGVPAVLFTAHGWQFAGEWPPAMRLAMVASEWVAGRLSTAIVCVSDYDRMLALRMRLAAPDRVVVVHNGVDPHPWQGHGVPATAEEGARPRTAVMVGRLTVQKDPATLLRAWRAVPRVHRLILAGGGPLLPDLQAQSRREGLEEHVTFMPSATDIPALLRAADVFVLSSRWEGLPLAVIEAMMSGLPVVGTRVGGVAEIVVDGETGLLVPPKDPEALASALNRLLGDAGLRRRMGEAGRRRALERFTEDRMLAETTAVYARALGVRVVDGSLTVR